MYRRVWWMKVLIWSGPSRSFLVHCITGNDYWEWVEPKALQLPVYMLFSTLFQMGWNTRVVGQVLKRKSCLWSRSTRMNLEHLFSTTYSMFGRGSKWVLQRWILEMGSGSFLQHQQHRYIAKFFIKKVLRHGNKVVNLIHHLLSK